MTSTTMTNPSDRLAELGITLPTPPKPVAAYVPAVISGHQIYVSGQLPSQGGQIVYKGKLGRDVSIEDGYQAARLCAINALAVIADAIGHDWSKLVRIVRVGGFVASAEGFTDQPKVVNGASELFQAVLGDRGIHARAAVGVSELPLGAAVEVEILAEIIVG